jgi:azurin
MDEIGVSAGAFHALWTLNGLGAADFDTVVKALRHPAQGVRRAALKILPSAPQSAQAILDAGVLKDREPLVRLTALLALADQPPSDLVGAELFKLNNDPSIAKEQWLPTALTIAATRHSNGFLAAALAAAPPLAAGESADKPASVNLVQNGGFEEIENGQPAHWKVANFGGSAEHKVEAKGRNGGNCVMISSPKEKGADTAWATQLSLEENTDYLFSAWIKTDGIRGATGALLEIHQAIGGKQPHSKPVTDKGDWQQVSFKISTGKQHDFQLNCLFGGWGLSNGKAWFDDVSCVKLGPTGSATASDGIADLLAVSRTFARVATPTQMTALNVLLASKPSMTGRAISEGLRNPSKPKTPENMAELAKTHQIVNIKAVEGLKYDVLNVTVKANRPIALVFQDADQLQHNLVIVKPGAIEKCCLAADVMAAQPDAIQRNYIPSAAEILHATKLLNPGDIEILKFELKEPGDYPYFCTFPGHCHVMRGTLKVEP